MTAEPDPCACPDHSQRDTGDASPTYRRFPVKAVTDPGRLRRVVPPAPRNWQSPPPA